MFQFSTKLNLDRITMNNLIKQGTTMSNKSSNKSVGSNIEQTQIFLLVGSAVWLLTSRTSVFCWFHDYLCPRWGFLPLLESPKSSVLLLVFLNKLLFDFFVSGRFLKLYFFLEFKFNNHRRSGKLFLKNQKLLFEIVLFTLMY